MKLYKFLDCDMGPILDEISNYLMSSDEYQVGFTQIPTEDLFSSVPSIRDWFMNLKCFPSHTYLIRTPPGSNKENAHVDNWIENQVTDIGTTTQFILAVNFPVDNTTDTSTSFYEYIDGPIKNLEFGSYDVFYRYYGKANLKQIDSYSLNRPAIINTSVPHSVINNTEKDRVALTFRFDRDPWHLFYDL
jgi:hypothetical protein